MGGRPSKSARRGCCAPRERAFLLVAWDAAFLNRMMRTPTAPTADLEEGQGQGQGSSSTASPGGAGGLIPDLSQVFSVAPPPVVDARRLLTLVESSHNSQPPPSSRFSAGTTFTRWVRARLVLFTPEMASSLAQLHQNTRLWHIFRRRLYLPILGPRELQAQVVNRALHRFQRRSRRRGPGVMVIVAGDGSLEATPSFAASLRAMLRWGHRLEVWSWDGAVPSLYKELAGEVGEGRVHVRYLNDHRQAIRYRTGRRIERRNPAGAAAAGAAAGGGGSAPTSLPVAMPMAVPLEGGGGAFAVAHAHAPLPPLGKDDGGEADRAAAAMAGLKIGEDGEMVDGEGEGEDDDSSDEEHSRRQSHDQHDEDDDAPEPFLDPLTMEIMVDPVLTPSGYSYERAVIVDEIRRRALDPMTQQPLAEEDLRPNRALREMIEMWQVQRRTGWAGGGAGGGGGGGGEGGVGESKGRG